LQVRGLINPANRLAARFWSPAWRACRPSWSPSRWRAQALATVLTGSPSDSSRLAWVCLRSCSPIIGGPASPRALRHRARCSQRSGRTARVQVAALKVTEHQGVLAGQYQSQRAPVLLPGPQQGHRARVDVDDPDRAGLGRALLDLRDYAARRPGGPARPLPRGRPSEIPDDAGRRLTQRADHTSCGGHDSPAGHAAQRGQVRPWDEQVGWRRVEHPSQDLDDDERQRPA